MSGIVIIFKIGPGIIRLIFESWEELVGDDIKLS